MLMKFILSIMLTFSHLIATSSVEDLIIGKFDFVIIKKSYDIYDSKGEVMQLYREERNKNLVFALRLTLKDVTGDCSSKGLVDGVYEIDEKGITLYSLWNRGGKAYLEPYGARVQRYEIQADSSLKQVSSRLYIETARKKHALDEGMKYLFRSPTSDKEKKSFNAYIAEVERIYKAKFVYGDEKDRLIKEVKEALRKKKKRVWSKR
jgi:hypothetical protein